MTSASGSVISTPRSKRSSGSSSSGISARASSTSSSGSTCSGKGLDLPEVSLVAILDADKEGFLRSTTALIQTFGRAARHVEGRAILYADVLTDSIKAAIAETDRRRALQVRYNAEHGITPAIDPKSGSTRA